MTKTWRDFPHWATEDESVVLVNADCLEVLPCLEAGSVDAVVTDPPYGIGFQYESHDDSIDGYESLMQTVVPMAQSLVCEGGGLFWWQGMLRASEWHKWFPSGYRLLASCKNFVQMRPTAVQYSFDPVVFWWNGDAKISPQNGRRDWHLANTAKWVCDKETKGIHPCQRPIDAVEYVVFCASDLGDLILDPFAGSLTSAVAAIRTGRRCIVIEKERQYYELGIERVRKELERYRLFEPPPAVRRQQELIA